MTKASRFENENMVWYENGAGEFHRERGPAAIFIGGQKDGTKQWYNNGKIIKNIDKNGDYTLWNVKGQFHNLKGPAVIENGKKEYWIDGIQYKDVKEYKRMIKLYWCS